MCFGVRHDIQVNKFLKLEGARFHVFDDVHEEHGYIFTSGHCIDDSSDSLLFRSGIHVVEFGLQLCDLTSFLRHWDLIFKI